MGESKKDALRVDFDKKLKLEFHGVKVISDAGSLAYREIGHVFGLTDILRFRRQRFLSRVPCSIRFLKAFTIWKLLRLGRDNAKNSLKNLNL